MKRFRFVVIDQGGRDWDDTPVWGAVSVQADDVEVARLRAHEILKDDASINHPYELQLDDTLD